MTGSRLDNTYYYHNDPLGTPQRLTDNNATTVWQADYEAFGKTQIETEAITNNLRFPGQYYDQETGLYYNYYRYYDPSTGRYITSDPIGLQGGLNTYAYVGGNPLSYTDPTGEFINVPGVIGGALLEIGFQTAIQYVNNGGRLECVDIDWADVPIAGIGGGLFPGAGKVFTDIIYPGKIRKAKAILKNQLGRARTINSKKRIQRRINRHDNNLKDTIGGAIARQVVTRTAKAFANDPSTGSGGECGC